MAGGNKPGHTCSTKGARAAKDGTNCNTVAPKPGPIGLMTQEEKDIAEAKAADEEMRKNYVAPKSDEAARKVILKGIELIEKSPLYLHPKPDGIKNLKSILAMVKELNKNENIVYAGVSGDRGSWDGQTMRIDIDYMDRPLPTAVELVHEGTHALWKKNHPKPGKNPSQENIDDEFNAQKNQLIMYRYLNMEKGFLDGELDARLEKLEAGTLRQSIADRMTGKTPD